MGQQALELSKTETTMMETIMRLRVFRAFASATALSAAITGCASTGSDLSSQTARSTATPEQCQALANLRVANVQITQATPVTEGRFTPPEARSEVSGLPPFCRVAGMASPTSDSVIRFEVWMPLQGWNGKFNQAGNGGYGRGLRGPGAIMAPALKRGYAVAGTDMGHPATVGYDASWANGHPEKVVDWGHRANHETARVSKALIGALYSSAPRHSYFTGCSDGGHEALMEAQRYPDDFDGIIVGAPANNWTGLAIAHMWQARAILRSGLTNAKLAMLHSAVVQQCDPKDGVTDGVIDNPKSCKFDLTTLQCPASADSDACLTPAQIGAVREIYAGPTSPAGGESIYPGMSPGTEASWNFVTAANGVGGVGPELFRQMVYGDAKWDFTAADLFKAYADTGRISAIIDAKSPNLDAFRKRGGKMIYYHGAMDQALSALESERYVQRVAGRLPGGFSEASEFFRYFSVPGMQHCGGGAGVDTFDALTALELWVEKGTAPVHLTASRTGLSLGANIMSPATGGLTRRLCPYPQVAVYKGEGSTSDASNYDCAAP